MRRGENDGHGKDSALLVHLSCLDKDARLSSSPLFLSSWDIGHAFDSLSKEAMKVSWQRLGVPPGIAHWIAHLDDQVPTAIHSPWALEAWHQDGLGLGLASFRSRQPSEVVHAMPPSGAGRSVSPARLKRFHWTVLPHPSMGEQLGGSPSSHNPSAHLYDWSRLPPTWSPPF